jgi:hypothetical protein
MKKLKWNRESVAVCNCGRPMLPLPATWEDSNGCGWVCLDSNCGDFGGGEIYADSLESVGVPVWVADLVELLLNSYRDRLGE